jgi:hypothetical protein
MVAIYRASADSFQADKLWLWSPGQFTNRGFSSNFDLHPDGKRFAVLKAPSTGEVRKVDKAASSSIWISRR